MSAGAGKGSAATSRRLVAFDDAPLEGAAAHEDACADTGDVEIELERAELADLLDRVLALPPPVTRAVLIERYIRDAPLCEVAARLGLAEGALAKRLERGKVTLRRVLLTDLGDEAAAYGMAGGDADRWQQTRIWCPNCGQRWLLGRFDHTTPEYTLRCPACIQETSGACKIVSNPVVSPRTMGRTYLLVHPEPPIVTGCT